MSARRLTLMTVVALCTLLAFAPGASAAQTRNLLRTFGCAEGAAGCAVSDPAPLSNPQGEAVVSEGLEAGDVYVADTGNNRIEKFSSSGEFLLAFGGSVGGLGTNVCGGLVVCEPGTPGSVPGEFTNAQFVAVDQTTHDVYVADTGDGTVSKFSSAGVLEAGWGTGGQLNGSTTVPKEFGAIAGIAVGTTGTLYVLNTGKQVFEFKPGSELLTEVTLQEPFQVSVFGLGVNATGDFFLNSEGYIPEFGPAGEFISEFNGGAGALTVEPVSGELYWISGETLNTLTGSVPVGFGALGVAATAGGDVFLSNAGAGTVAEFGPPLPLPNVENGDATEITATSARLNGMVNPEGVDLKGCEFEYVEEAKYKYQSGGLHPYEGGGVVPCAESLGEIGNGTGPVPVHAGIAGLTAGTTYHVRLVAFNENNESKPSLGEDKSFATLPGPSIDSATVTDLTRESAVLNARINPKSSVTHYHFEYDTRLYEAGEGPHGVRVPATAGEDASIPAGASDVAASAPVGGLEREVTYYWRVVASNANATTIGAGHTFRYDTSGVGLADGRAYELVSPAHKNGAFLAVFSFPPHIAPDGSRMVAEAIQCFAGSEACTADRGATANSPYSFTRGSGGWLTASLAPPAAQFEADTVWGLDGATGNVLLSMPTSAALGGNGEDDFYVRTAQGLVHMGPNIPPASASLLAGRAPHGGFIGDEKQASTADFSHFAWEMTPPFEFDEHTGERTVYEYALPEDEGRVAGSGSARPLLVGVSGGAGSSSLVSECGTELAGTERDNIASYPGGMSMDGRTVFFTALNGEQFGCTASQPPADEIFARVDGELRPSEAHSLGVSEAHTVAVSEPSPSQCAAGQPGEVSCLKAAGEPANAEFVGASADGSEPFFLSPQQLTDEASENPNAGAAIAPPSHPHHCHVTSEVNGCNLYGFDLRAPAGHGLVDVSRGDSSGEGPRVQGVLAFSPDGSHVYFVAKGVLSTTPNGRGQVAQNGAENLYLFERDTAFPAGRTVFITGLVAGEPGVGDEAEWKGSVGEPANVSPDGRFLVFLSRGALTVDDTSSSGASQVFRYDAVTGDLTRVSVGNGGFNDNGNRGSRTACVNGNGCIEDAQIAPGVEAERSGPSMSDDGSRVFFQSPVGLTVGALDDARAGEVNGREVLAQNVYEWEREGVGSCPASRAAGCVFLISDGRDVFENQSNYGFALCEQRAATCLLGTDSEGKNVFFATAVSLVKGDTNTEIDFYDARVCEPQSGNPCVSEPPPPLPPCSGEECHGIPAATPGVPSAPTATFNGAGNLVPTPGKVTKKTAKCKRGFVKRKVKNKQQCVKKKNKKTKKARRATNDRRARS